MPPARQFQLLLALTMASALPGEAPQPTSDVDLGGSATPVRGYVQYYYGYGENLFDYDDASNRVSVGFLVNDWFQRRARIRARRGSRSCRGHGPGG